MDADATVGIAVVLCALAWPGWVAILAVVACVGLAVWSYRHVRARAISAADEISVLEEESAPETGQYKVMVAVANPDNALSLVRHTYRLCEAKNARVELLHMVPVPDHVPLADAEGRVLDGKEGIVEAMLYLATPFPVSTAVCYCRSVPRGIVSAVRQKRANMLVMGWHGRGSDPVFRLGSTVDPVIERAPCDVVVLKDCEAHPYKRVLVPLTGGPHGALALEVASILADKDAGEVLAFSVHGRGRPFDLDEFVREHQHRMVLPPSRVRTKVVESSNVVDAILAEAEFCDLLALGCSARSLLHRAARASIPETVADLCGKPVAMVRSVRRSA